MRIFTVVFIFILQERKICFFYHSTGNIILLYHYRLDFTQYT